ncbi:MAG: phosphopantetheine-binding protein [Clostridiales bacterium]|jgi:acyl carrier protein|nr:phosphopantetheine-binding protein [Clostridiales bacterium]
MLEKIAKILREYKDDETLQISESTTFEELKLDSLDTAELIMNIEEELDVTIDLDEAIKTVGELIKVIEKSQ